MPWLPGTRRPARRASTPILGEAQTWSTNLGYPGYANAAMDEISDQRLLARGMFAAAARGEMSPEDAVKRAEAEKRPIFEKWRGAGERSDGRVRLVERRDFLRLTAGAAVATAAGCGSGSEKKPRRGGQDGREVRGRRTHAADRAVDPSVPAYDQWFDRSYTQRWGAEHDVRVTVDHVSFTDLSPRAAAEIAAPAARRLGFLAPPSSLRGQGVVELWGTVSRSKPRWG